jgi:hypothetical protein
MWGEQINGFEGRIFRPNKEGVTEERSKFHNEYLQNVSLRHI